MASYSVKRRFSNQLESFCSNGFRTTILVPATCMVIMACLGDVVFFAGDAAASCLAPDFGEQTIRQIADRSSGDADDVSIEKLIAQLGDSHYMVRDEAESKLLKIGGPAIARLRRATTHRDDRQPDSEIRLRATRLLILIERKEHNRQIREFLEGNGSDLNFSGWPEFSTIAGSDRVARKLFVDMHQAQPDLMATLKKDKNSVEEAYQNVSKRSLRSNTYTNATQTIGTLTAMLFVSTLEFSSEENQSQSRISVGDADVRRIQIVLTQPPMITFVNRSGNQAQIGRLVSNWLGTLPNDENASIVVQLSVIGAYQLTDQLNSVTSFAKNRRLPPPTRITAIDIFGNLADKDDAAKLQSLLDDRTVVGNYLPRIGIATAKRSDGGTPSFSKNRPRLMQVQIRDLALATSIKLTQLDPGDFGFDRKCFSGDNLIRNYAGFFSQEDRKSSFDKWAQRDSFD